MFVARSAFGILSVELSERLFKTDGLASSRMECSFIGGSYENKRDIWKTEHNLFRYGAMDGKKNAGKEKAKKKDNAVVLSEELKKELGGGADVLLDEPKLSKEEKRRKKLREEKKAAKEQRKGKRAAKREELEVRVTVCG